VDFEILIETIDDFSNFVFNPLFTSPPDRGVFIFSDVGFCSGFSFS
jgi:hypothetical protein